MSDDQGLKKSEIRERVLNALALIHLSDVVFLKKSDSSPQRISYDLLTFWLDHVYAPGMRYMDGLKGDRDPEQVSIFQQSFNDEEMEWLERFNRFLELRIDRLRPAELEAREFPIKDTWNGIVRDAGNLIALMEPDMLKGKARLDRVRSEISLGGRLSEHL